MNFASVLVFAGCLVLLNALDTAPLQNEVVENETFSLESSHIQLRLSVEETVCGSLYPPFTSSYFLSNLEYGSNLFSAMQKASEELGFSFVHSTHHTHGSFIEAVNGVHANDSLHQYWAILDAWTGQYLPVSVDNYIPINGEHILLKFSLY